MVSGTKKEFLSLFEIDESTVHFQFLLCLTKNIVLVAIGTFQLFLLFLHLYQVARQLFFPGPGLYIILTLFFSVFFFLISIRTQGR